jgi:hypothetical protein
MSGERFVLLGVARARSLWFRSVAQWATSAAVPAEFVKCVSTEELRAHLTSGRTFSAALLDGGLPTVDRDVIAAARETRCAAVVVSDGHGSRDWYALGATAVLPPTFSRDELLEVLSAHATMVGSAERRVATTGGPPEPEHGEAARVIAVCGPGGTGASTVAIALSQQLARDRAVVLADLALRAEQAVLHDARDIAPGLQELVEAHRGGRPSADEVRRLTFDVAERGYRLLLGLRRPRYWSAVRPRAFQAAFGTLTRTFDILVCDITADFEGEDSGGSRDVEERNLMARTAVMHADAVMVVGTAGVKGVHALVRVVSDLVECGVSSGRIIPVINQAPRSPRARAEITAAVAELAPTDDTPLAPPIFLPRRRVETALRDGVLVPSPLGSLTGGAVKAALRRAPGRPPGGDPEPEVVVPGTLGSWGPEA